MTEAQDEGNQANRDRWSDSDLERVQACPICGCFERTALHVQLRDLLLGVPGTWAMYSCSQCRTAYLDPRPSPSAIERCYVDYQTHIPHAPAGQPRSSAPLAYFRRALKNGYLEGSLGYRLDPRWPLGRWVVPLIPGQRGHIAKSYMQLSSPHPSQSRLLDIGCGNGAFLQVMRDLGWEAHGVETDPQSAAIAQGEGLRVTCGDVGRLDAPDGFFNAITMRHVIEHLHDPGATLTTVRQLLADDGVLVINTPNVESRGHRLFKDHWRGLEPPRHLVLFSGKSLDLALARAGFSKRKRGPTILEGGMYHASAQIANHDVGSRPRGIRLKLQALAGDFETFRHHREGEELFVVAGTLPQ